MKQAVISCAWISLLFILDHVNGFMLRQQQQPTNGDVSAFQFLTSASTATSWASTQLQCQLLGMNCATPTDFTFSMQGFRRRGGETDVHSDGWGVAFYQDQGLRQFHDVEPAANSSLANYLSETPIRTLNMMGHIRYATVGSVDLANVHPFSREMWGLQWCFCHNGEVPKYKDVNTVTTDLQASSIAEQYYHPIGSTDSEATFCAILNALRSRFQTLPSLPILHEAIRSLCQEIVDYDRDGTILNFLLSCGPYTQFAYSWPGSRPGSTVWNGLHYTVREFPFSHHCELRDTDYSVDFSLVTTDQDCVSVIATAPLTYDEEWVEMERGQLILFDDGKPHESVQEMFEIELLGHGLASKVMQKTLEADMKQYNIDPTLFLGGEGI